MGEFQRPRISVIAVLERGVPNTEINSQLAEAGRKAKEDADKECGGCEYGFTGPGGGISHRRAMEFRRRSGLA